MSRAGLITAGFMTALVGSAGQGMQTPVEALATEGHGGLPRGYSFIPTFNDEFEGDRLDRRVWNTVYADPRSGESGLVKRLLPSNGERQVYFDRNYLDLGIDPFSLSNGILTISAEPLDARAKARLATEPVPTEQAPVFAQVAYSSGLITTRGTFVQKGGYFEIRARWSGGRGIWPAFWLLSDDGRWPPEIDVLEGHGDKPTIVFHSAHSALRKPKSITEEVLLHGSPQVFHRYGVLWLPDRLDFYVDGRRTATLAAPPDLDRPMYLIANLAIGGYWAGFPNSATRFPVRMEIDYIKVWRLDRSAASPQ